MNATTLSSDSNEVLALDSVHVLSQAFFRRYPNEAARKLETLPPADAAVILHSQPQYLRQKVWKLVTPIRASKILPEATDELALELISSMDAGPGTTLLSLLEEDLRERYLSSMSEAHAHELRELLDYPANTAGFLMETGVLALSKDLTAKDAMAQLKDYPSIMRKKIYCLDETIRLHGEIDLEQLVVADPTQTLSELCGAITQSVGALDPQEDAAEKLKKNDLDMIPVVDIHHRLLGVIHGVNAIEAVKEDIAGNLQTMVGVSRDERALSSSFFAVRKRQSWLQINLLTGFLAASVVGLFESTIAQFTALAVLMPIAAGQSGNTGAQALAVTMRGITLREITTRHWFRIAVKEAGAGFINGIAIAITCGAGVYLWSRSFGLALVIALAMVISMTIAGIAGGLVPICLKKLGLDPAQSSSIILTTVTDIAGFMSFLGIAAALSSMLV